MPVSNTRDNILDAVIEVVSRVGLRSLSVEAVADAAGVSRQTVYRHFRSRDGLIEDSILREEQAFIDDMLHASQEAESLHAAVAEAVLAALHLAREHPVLRRVLEQEPEALLPYFLLGRGPVISAAEPAVEDLLRRFRPSLAREQLRLTADMATRLLVSYVVSPSLETPDATLASHLAGLVVHLADRSPLEAAGEVLPGEGAHRHP